MMSSFKYPKHPLERLNYEDVVKQYKTMKLSKTPETQWEKDVRGYVHRSRLIGCDRVVRAPRFSKSNRGETGPIPRNSTYYKMLTSFNKLRRNKVQANWNIPAWGSWTNYWCSLPDCSGPRITHWKDLGNVIGTGLMWTQDWEPVPDSIEFDCINGATEILINELTDIDVSIGMDITEHDGFDSVNVIFRGDGETCLAKWEWTDQMFTAEWIEPEPIGSVVNDISRYLPKFALERPPSRTMIHFEVVGDVAKFIKENQLP